MAFVLTTLTIKDGAAATRSIRAIDESGSGAGPYRPVHNVLLDTLYPVYSAGFDITGYATPTDLVALIGSATKTIKVTRIGITGQATGNEQIDITLVKRSTANTGGTTTAITAVPHDSNDGAATASLVKYTAAPTLGTLVGAVRDAQLTIPGSTRAYATSAVEWDFTKPGSKPIVLRGTSQLLALNFQGAALPAGMSLSCDIEWTEES